MNIKFPEANDQLEADGNKHKQGRTIHYSKMGKNQGLQIPQNRNSNG